MPSEITRAGPIELGRVRQRMERWCQDLADAFVGARDWDSAQRLERTLASGQSLPTRHGETTRRLGLPACRALIAFGSGNDILAITLLASLPALAHRLGGSHAQRDVLHLTLLQAIERIRRPSRRKRLASRPIAAQA